LNKKLRKCYTLFLMPLKPLLLKAFGLSNY